MHVKDLELILRYKMTKEESLAYGIAVLYIEIAKKYFPDYKHYTFKRGDPRKKELFRYCWKLLHETKDKLGPDEYRYYVQAQMSVLKNIRKSAAHPYIHPICLVGKSAWNRWMLWKKYFDHVKVVSNEEAYDKARLVRRSLCETHYALRVRLGDITKNSLCEAMRSGFLFRLVALNVVSPYFVILSPTVSRFVEENKVDLRAYGLDCELYQDEVGGARAFYEELFRDV